MSKRKKAWIGAAIAAAASIGSAIYGAASSNSAKRKQEKEILDKQIIENGYQQASAMSKAFNNTNYIDDYNNKIVMKNGGKYTDRIKRDKVFACGGRKRNKCGGRIKAKWGSDDTASLTNGLSSSASSAIATGISNSGSNYIVTPKDKFDYMDRIERFKCGGRKSSKCRK